MIKGYHYVEVFSLVFAIYEIDDVFACTSSSLESYEKSPGVASTECAKRLYTNALRRGPVYTEKKVKLLFVEELEETICKNVLLYCSRNPSERLT